MPIANLPTGVDLYYESHGQGEPLVLFPSTAFSGEVWRPFQVTELSRSLNLIIHDPRGCGRSHVAQEVYTIDQMANDVVALLDHLGIRSAHVLGHSMGGRIALSMALNFPGRVKSLIMAASGSGPAARPGSDCIPGLPYRIVLELIEMGFENSIRHEICGSDTFFTKDFRDRFPARVEDFFRLAWATHAKLPEYVHLIIARHNWEGTHRLGDLKVPTLVVIGDADAARSNHLAQAEILANRIRGAELKILNGQSHGFFWQAPEETNAMILSWIKDHSEGKKSA